MPRDYDGREVQRPVVNRTALERVSEVVVEPLAGALNRDFIQIALSAPSADDGVELDLRDSADRQIIVGVFRRQLCHQLAAGSRT